MNVYFGSAPVFHSVCRQGGRDCVIGSDNELLTVEFYPNRCLAIYSILWDEQVRY